MLRLRLRDPKGKFISGDMKESRKEIDLFGERVIRDGKNILRFFKKDDTGNLMRGYDFNSKYTKNGADINLSFGLATFYWKYIDEGVRGAGGFKGSGRARGAGSFFKFSTKQPPLSAILPWVKRKGLGGGKPKSVAFAIALSIKRRGLTRTQFVTRPIEDNFKRLPDEVVKGLAIDLEALLEKLPDPLNKGTMKLAI